MSTDRFKAGVKYGDWKGTVAADDADPTELYTVLKSKKVYDSDKEFILGVDISIGENVGG